MVIDIEFHSKETWANCLNYLQNELSSLDFDTWIKPLRSRFENNIWVLFAPNQFVKEEIKNNFYLKIKEFLGDFDIKIGNIHSDEKVVVGSVEGFEENKSLHKSFSTNLNPSFTFDTFVEGKSNQVAKAAGLQIAAHQGQGFNPLFIYGGVGLGKTHLMQAVGNEMQKRNPHLKVLYLHSERFVNEMIRALQTNVINQFKENYRSLDALLVDDIQFFAGKERSQEELFHIFNALLESGKQMIFTCDRYPKGIERLEERLKSRFGWGLTVAVEPPELETRVAILLNKSKKLMCELSPEVAFFIAKRVTSNVRELEGSLKRVIANSQFTGRDITIELAKEALKDLISLQQQLITIENIQKTVAEYYKIKVSNLLSKSRSRVVTRPRQIAMALAKELTSHSLPEIGEAFGGRDHTTVLHSCRLIAELRETQNNIKEDFQNLMRILST
jgi:chromosomal replication initiator protein